MELREPQTGQEEQADGTDTEGSGGATGTEGEGIREPTLGDLVGILQAHMGQQETQEARLRARHFWSGNPRFG